MLLLIGSLGLPEIIFILVLALLIFGPKKLPEIGRSLGKGFREFKRGTSGFMDSLNDDINKATHTPSTPKPLPPPQPAATGQPPSPTAKSEASAEVTETVIDLESGETHS